MISPVPAFESLADFSRGILEVDEVHVWCVELEASPELAEWFEGLLCPEEIARANKFRFPELRARFVAARGLLRSLLWQYTGIAAKEIQFTYGARGKPAVIGETPIRFNMAHSGAYACYAFGFEREIGVDLEQHKRMPDLESIAQRFFSPQEVDDLLGLRESERPGAFFACWTRKESFVKAVGEGLFLPLDSFRVSVRPGEPAKLLAMPEEQRHRDWILQEAPAPEGYSCAVTVGRGPARLRCLLVKAAETMAFRNAKSR